MQFLCPVQIATAELLLQLPAQELLLARHQCQSREAEEHSAGMKLMCHNCVLVYQDLSSFRQPLLQE